MKSNLEDSLDARIKNVDDRDRKKLKINLLQRLIKKLENDENQEIERELNKLIQQIPSSPVERIARRTIRKSLSEIQKKVKQEFGYVEKGSVIAINVGVWIALGIPLGAAFDFGGSSGTGAGLGTTFGIVLGAAIGSAKEKQLEKDGMLY